MQEDQHFSNDPVENEHLKQYIEKKLKRNSRLRVGRKNKLIKKNRRKLLLKTAVPLCLIFLLIAIISGYFASPYSKVSKITLQAPAAQTQLKNHLPIKVGDSLRLLKKRNDKINYLVQQKNLNVKNVKIIWKKHNQAVVKVTFYKFNAYLVDKKQYYAVNARGQISDEAVSKPKQEKNLLLLQGFSKKSSIKMTLQQYEKLPTKLQHEITEIKNEATVADNQKIRIMLVDGNQVVLKSSQLATKMAYYPSIKATLKRPSVVNMEYGSYSTPIR